MRDLADKSSLGAGLGLRRDFIEELNRLKPASIGWLELAPENYLERGGAVFEAFEELATVYPLAAHGLQLSIGSLDPLNWDDLKKLKFFLRKYSFTSFTDHLCISSFNNHYFHDLLPLPFTWEALRHVVERVKNVQDFLEIPFGLENITYYFQPCPPQMDEIDFISEVITQTNSYLLLDINNVYVNAVNHQRDAQKDLERLSQLPLLYCHLAGHTKRQDKLLIDNHGSKITDPVWDLLNDLGQKIALPPCLIERDYNIPSLGELLLEVNQAQEIYLFSHQKFRDLTHVA